MTLDGTIVGTNSVRRPRTGAEAALRERVRGYEYLLRLIIRTSADNSMHFDRHKPRGLQGEFMAGWISGWADAARYAGRAFPQERSGRRKTAKKRRIQ